jgi:hypothetical protein
LPTDQEVDVKRLVTYLALGATAALVSTFSYAGSVARVEAQASVETQRLLGPGLYIFQTRLDHESCGESSDTGFVTSYFAAVNGIPGSRTMQMKLLNSDYWSTWTLTVTPENHIMGDSQQDRVTGPTRGESHFELTRQRDRFTGRGSRTYTATIGGQAQRCRMAYDALIRRIDG